MKDFLARWFSPVWLTIFHSTILNCLVSVDPLKQPDKKDGQLVQKEHKEVGAVALRVYKQYMSACGYWLMLFMMVLQVGYHVLLAWSNIILSLWAEESTEFQTNQAQLGSLQNQSSNFTVVSKLMSYQQSTLLARYSDIMKIIIILSHWFLKLTIIYLKVMAITFIITSWLVLFKKKIYIYGNHMNNLFQNQSWA